VKLFLLPVLESLEFGRQVIRYALIFVSAFFRQRTSLACDKRVDRMEVCGRPDETQDGGQMA
jgi:hypothetical protein